MPGLAEELRALGKLKRTRSNYEKVADKVAELKANAESASTVLNSLAALRENAEDLESALGDAAGDNPLLEWSSAVSLALTDFLAALPGEDGFDISELVEEADGFCDAYGDAQDDTGYSAQDREEAWGALLDSLENIARALEVPANA
jgi:hypothetical protein